MATISKSSRLPGRYILWGIAYVPTVVLTACGTCALVAGINALFPVGVLASAAIGILPVFAIAKAFFAWMYSVFSRPLSSYLHVIGATCVLTEILLILVACWSGDTFDQNTPIVLGLLVVYVAVVVSELVCSLRFFMRRVRCELKTQEDMKAFREAKSKAPEKEQAAKSRAKEEPELSEPYEEPDQEYNCPPNQCCFGPMECIHCGGCITGSGTHDFYPLS